MELIRRRGEGEPGGRRLTAAVLLLSAGLLAAAGGAGTAFAAKKGPAKEPPGTLATHPLGALVADELKLMVEEAPADLAALRDLVVRHAIYDYGLAQAARDGLEKDPAYLEKTGGKRTKILAEHFYAKEIFAASRPTPAEVDAAMGNLVPLPMVHQIIVATREEAEAARARVLAGEMFQDVAQQVSTGLSAGYGGMVGYLLPGSGHYTPQEERLIRSLQADEVSAVCPGPLGYSVFWVRNIRSVEEQKKNSYENQEKQMHSGRLQAREQEVLERLRKRAKVKVNEDVVANPPTGNAPHPAVLAQIDDEYIFAGGFFEQAGGGSGHGKGVGFGFRDRMRILSRAIDNILYRREALRLGLDKDAEVKKPLEKLRREHLWDVWLDKQGRKMKNRPREMSALMEQMQKKITVREQALPEVLKTW